MHIQELLSVMVEKKASDIHIKVGRPPLQLSDFVGQTL